MRVARLHAARDLRLSTEPDPVPGDGETLIRVGAVGLCGSDLHWWTDGGVGETALDSPVVPGHEAAGTVVGGPWDGRVVAIDPAIPCGRCARCLDGDPNLCPAVRFAGHGATDGPLRELMTWPTDRLHPLPASMDAVDGAMLEPLGVAIHAVDLAHVRLGATAAVVGLGPIGLLAIQVLRAAGAHRVVGVEPLAHRRRAAEDLGIDAVVDPQDAAALADELGDGADVVLEIAGEDDAIDTAVRPGPPRRQGDAGRDPEHQPQRVPGRRGPAQGTEHAHGAPDEGGLPARHRAGGRRRRPARTAGDRTLRARGRRRGLRARRRAHGCQDGGPARVLTARRARPAQASRVILTCTSSDWVPPPA